MPKKVTKRAPKGEASKTGSRNSKDTKSKPSKTAVAATSSRTQPSQAKPSQPSANSKFVQDLLTRGEAAKLTKDGKLPLQATHIIRKQSPDGAVEVKRARFKLF